MSKVIEVKKLNKSYGSTKVLDNLSFEVEKGEILGLLGPNGSGKTTTINSILSLLNYESGTIKIMGKNMTPDSFDIKKNIGVIFQDVAVFDELSVFDNVDYFCGLYIKDKKKRRDCVTEALKLVGLEAYKKYTPKQLSGGLLRRLNIACGIAHKPSIIFFDEPTVAVDPQSRNNILEGIIRFGGETVKEVEILCDRIIILDKGVILASGTSDELKELANIDEKITVEGIKVSKKILEELNNNKNVDEVHLQKNTLKVTYKKGKNN